ncbi:MAG: hypothetical protein JWM74_6005 [Myxococcaceae bacterium]|nr:hypothetical protein [Myxococcaceae bacterium]
MPGTRPAIGNDACVPVGTTTCAAGFERDVSGWGCAAVLPPAPCVGATRPKLGDRTCAPVGDCSAAYPPAGAILVDPALDPAAVDATHVRTVADALAIAPSGATIALADGMHTTPSFTVSKPLTLVGRCAERAHLVSAQPAGATGISIDADVTLRGLTVDGYTSALLVSGRVTLIAEDIVVEKARSRAVFAKLGANVTLRRSVVRGTAPLGLSDQTIAVLVGTSATVALEDSAILASLDGALAVTDNVDTRASLTRSVVQDVKPRGDGVGGGALRAFEGAHLDVTESAILGSSGIAILTLRKKQPPPQVTLTRSVVSGTQPTTQTGTSLGTAINAAYDAVVTITESTIADSNGTALYAAEKAKITFTKSVVVRVMRTPDLASQGGSAVKSGMLTLEDSAVVNVGGGGVGGWSGGHVTMLRSLVRDVGGDVVQGFTEGQGLSAIAASTIDATDSAVVNALELGVTASNAGSTIHLDNVLVTRTDDAPAPRFGHGVLSVDQAAITLSRTIIERHVGVGLFCAAGAAVASASLIRNNAVGVHTQDGSAITEVDAAPDPVPAHDLTVVTDTHFDGNATKVSSDVLPLPAPIAEPPAAM